MSSGAVVFSSSIRCGRCGRLSSGYLQVSSDGNGVATCVACGATIVQPLERGHISQVPPIRSDQYGGGYSRPSRYPGLYVQPKHAPRLDLRNLMVAAVAPKRAMQELYLSTELRHAMLLVLVSATVYAVVSAVVTGEMSDVIGVGDANALELFVLGAMGWIVAIFSFLVFAVVSSMVAHEVFGGRGDKGPTVILAGYCYPWFVLVTVVLLALFTFGFGGLELSDVQDWTNAEMNRAIGWGILLLVIAVLGLVWVLSMAGRAVSVANDVSGGEGILSVIVGAIAAGLVSLVVGAVMRLPIGLTF